MSNTIKKWHEVYSSDKECRFFKALARNKNYQWRTAKSIATEAKLTIEEVEEIAEKYIKSGQVKQQDKDPSMFGYFERFDAKTEKPSIADANKNKRMTEDQQKAP